MRILSLLYALPLITAAPTAIEERQQGQAVDVQFTVSGAQFQSFEDPATLESYLRSRGVNYNLNYNQLSRAVVQVDQYFSNKASSARKEKRQFNTLDDSPIKTHTNSTSLKGGPNYTNVTASANATFVDVISFSDGNAATAGGAIQRTVTSSSTASSGKSNSTATVTGTASLVQIDLMSMVQGAQDSRTVNGGQQDALTAGSCSSLATGASASSSITTTFTVPVNTTGSNSVDSVARSFCEAGMSARNSGRPGGSGTSTGGTQAALTSGGVSATVRCNGRQSTNNSPTVSFTGRLRGNDRGGNNGFAGTFTLARTSSASISCN